MSLCLKKKKKQATAPRSRWGQQFQQETQQAKPSTNPMLNQLKQVRREREDKQRKEYLTKLGWETCTKKKTSIESTFESAPAEDEEEEADEEEIPVEARIRMKNVGRYTKTSAGPNSYHKSTSGFQDSKALLKARQKQVEDMFYSADKREIDTIKQEKIARREKYHQEQRSRELQKRGLEGAEVEPPVKVRKSRFGPEIQTDNPGMSKQTSNTSSRSRTSSSSSRPPLDEPLQMPTQPSSYRRDRYLPKDNGLFSQNRPFDPDFESSPPRGYYGDY